MNLAKALGIPAMALCVLLSTGCSSWTNTGKGAAIGGGGGAALGAGLGALIGGGKGAAIGTAIGANSRPNSRLSSQSRLKSSR